MIDEVSELSSKYYSLGQALRLRPSDLDMIAENNPRNARLALNQVIVCWLEENYNVVKYGQPTWRMLVKAVAHPCGGGNGWLARTIAGNHAQEDDPFKPILESSATGSMPMVSFSGKKTCMRLCTRKFCFILLCLKQGTTAPQYGCQDRCVHVMCQHSTGLHTHTHHRKLGNEYSPNESTRCGSMLA